MVRRFLPLGLLVLGLVLALALGLDRYLTLDALREHRSALAAFAAAHLAAALGLYALAYVLVVAFSLPGGAVMTLLGGFLFGTWIGGAVTVVSATIGAVLIFLAARTALAAPLRTRAGPWLKRLEAGFGDNAVSYLLALRLIPLFPFFVVNIAPAFLGVPLRVYAWTTLVGIVPGTFVYASVGNGLGALLDAGRTPDLGIIFSPEILGPLLGLAALSFLPMIYKRLKEKRK